MIQSKTPRTRRAMLLGLAACTAATASLAAPALADDPAASIAKKRRVLASLAPAKSRTIRLKPIASEMPRTVVTAVASDPRGEFVAVAGDDNAIRILDATSMRVAKTLNSHRDLIRTLAFDREGQKLVSAGNDGQLIVWDRDANFKIHQRMQGTPALTCVRFSPDGKEMAAVGFDSTVYLIGPKTRAHETATARF